MRQAQAFIETRGLTAAVTTADIALKSANVELIGIELSRGQGFTTVKITGDVGAVKAAVDAATNAIETREYIVSKTVIARPAEGLDMIVYSKDTIGLKQDTKAEEVEGDEQKVDKQKNIEENTEEDEVDVKESEDITCNLCHDPDCPREKGDPRIDCIHADDEE